MLLRLLLYLSLHFVIIIVVVAALRPVCIMFVSCLLSYRVYFCDKFAAVLLFLFCIILLIVCFY